MFEAKINTSIRVPVVLVSALDGTTPIPSKSGADLTAVFFKADGTTASYAVSGLTFTELTTGIANATGTYQLTVPSGVNSVAGPVLGVLSVSGCKIERVAFDVVTNIESDTYTRIGTPVVTVSADIASIKSDTSTISTSVGSNLGTNVSAIDTKIGTPVVSVSADIAGVQTTTNTINTSVGSNLGTNVSAINTSVGLNLGTNVSTINTSVGSNLGSNVTAIDTKLGTPVTTIAGDIAAIGASIDLTPVLDAVAAVQTTVDDIQVSTDDLITIEQGRWKIHTTGPDANRLVLYQLDGTTVLKKFDLKDSSGVATTEDPFERVPV